MATLKMGVHCGQQVNIAVRPPVDYDALQSYAEDIMPAFASKLSGTLTAHPGAL